MHPPPAIDRLAREAEALRENLRKRKAQARARAESGPASGQDGTSHATPPAALAGLTTEPPKP